MWQQLVMALLVVAAAGYVVWTFLPMMRRQRLLDALAAHGLLTRTAARHRARLATPGCVAIVRPRANTRRASRT